MVRDAVAATGDPRVKLVDVYAAFQGHDMCDGDPWADGITVSIFDPISYFRQGFHPNAKGHAREAEFVKATLRSIGIAV
jgi:lysophospholipase L1-like esterase